MLWPVLLSHDPRDAAWSVGERVSTRLRWIDNPDLPDDLVLRQAVVQVRTLIDGHGQPWAQLVEHGDLRAVREGDHLPGPAALHGCLGFDAFLGLIGHLPAAVGVVRRVRLVQDLHDRGTHGWIRRRGATAPDGGARRLPRPVGRGPLVP